MKKEDWAQKQVDIEQKRVAHFRESQKLYRSTLGDIIAYDRYVLDHPDVSFNNFLTGRKKGDRDAK